MIVCKLWDRPYDVEGEDGWFIEATVLFDGEDEPDVSEPVGHGLWFPSYQAAYDFWENFNSVEGGVRWEDG